jgi:hypothetical protein
VVGIHHGPDPGFAFATGISHEPQQAHQIHTGVRRHARSNRRAPACGPYGRHIHPRIGVPKGPSARTEPAEQGWMALSGSGKKRAGGWWWRRDDSKAGSGSTSTVGSVLMNGGSEARPGPGRGVGRRGPARRGRPGWRRPKWELRETWRTGAESARGRGRRPDGQVPGARAGSGGAGQR